MRRWLLAMGVQEVVRKRFLIYFLFQNHVSGLERRIRIQSEYFRKVV